MPLTKEQEDAVRAEATRRGIDPEKLIKAADLASRDKNRDSGGSKAADDSGASSDQPKLYQYHLPFVTVREVRQVWLGLKEPFKGDDEIAAEWAAKFAGTGSKPDDDSAP
jgi:hypothetical protein